MKDEILKTHNPSGHYTLLDGDTEFHQAVNKLIKEYWVSTGSELSLENAMWSVVASGYNQFIKSK